MKVDVIEKIEELMAAKGWGQKDLVEATGISSANVSRYLNRKQKPGLDKIIIMMEVLGGDLSKLNRPKSKLASLKEDVSPYGRLSKEEKGLVEGFHEAPDHVQKTIKTLLHLKESKEKKTG